MTACMLQRRRIEDLNGTGHRNLGEIGVGAIQFIINNDSAVQVFDMAGVIFPCSHLLPGGFVKFYYFCVIYNEEVILVHSNRLLNMVDLKSLNWFNLLAKCSGRK